MIDDKAYVDPHAKIADNVEIGPWAWVGPGVEIGSGSTVGANAVIKGRTTIGENNQIMAFAMVGGDPQHLGYKGEETVLVIGNNNVIREYASIHRGTVQGGGKTQIGDHNYFMAYSHVGHDCRVGNHCIFANNAGLAGHVEIGDYIIFSAYSGIHQFCRIGSYAFIGRAAKIYKDIPAYMMVTGNPGCPTGVNLVGLKRHGFDNKTLRVIKRAFLLIYRSGKSLEDLRKSLNQLVSESSSISLIVEAFDHTTRGVERHQYRH